MERRRNLSDFIRVRGGDRCTICGSDHWCTYTNEGYIVCTADARGKGDQMDTAGYRQVKVDGQGGIHLVPEDNAKPVRFQARPRVTKPEPQIDWAPIQDKFYDAMLESTRYELAGELADRLGIGLAYLRLVGMGWSEGHGAWSFPMYRNEDNVSGIRLRAPNGSKYAVKGSKDGYFGLPIPLLGDNPQVCICEGPTDTAAMWQLGFTAIGRPSCRGASALIASMCADWHAVIVSDQDSPGRKGADALAKMMYRNAKSVKIIEPPHKDVRAWLAKGATHASVAFLIENARMYDGKAQVPSISK